MQRLSSGESDAVIAEEHHHRIFKDARIRNFLQDPPDLLIHHGDVVVGARDVVTDRRGVRVVGGHGDRVGVDGSGLSGSFGERPALMRHGQIEDGEERLIAGRSLSPMGLAAGVIPGRFGRLELIIGLAAIGTEAAFSSK